MYTGLPLRFFIVSVPFVGVHFIVGTLYPRFVWNIANNNEM